MNIAQLFIAKAATKESTKTVIDDYHKHIYHAFDRRGEYVDRIDLRNVHNGWLEIHDKRTIYELSRYVEVSPDVYHAEGQNENDDCVTSLIWALYYLKTDYYDSGATSKDGGSVDFSSFAILDGSIVGNGFGDSSIYESPFGNSGYDGNFYPGSNFF